jgi:hypothetical protein
MSLRQFAASLLLLLPAAALQAPLPGLRVEAIDAGSVLHVKNPSTQPLTAFVIELVDYPGSSFSLWQDEVESEPIPPGGEKRTRTTNMTIGAAPEYVKLQAALYADGTSAGIPEKVAQFIESRRARLETTRELIRRIEKAQSAGAPAASVAADLKTWADSTRPANPRKAPAWMGQLGPAARISRTAAELEKQSIAETLARLRASERALAASKPAL